MRAVVFRRHGGPDVLEQAEIPDPAVRPSDVRVRVKATALNHLDLWIREGIPSIPVEFPHVLGADIAGVVESVGSDVRGISVGDEVIVQPGQSCMQCEACLSGRDNACPSYKIVGEHRDGGYAELVSVPHHNVLPKPKGLSWEEAAAAPLVFLTAWEMLVKRAALQPGELVLVQAAGSGVGSAAIQIAKLIGATVIATAGSDSKLEKARELGADHTINYEKQDFVAETRRFSGRRGVDVVFDHVGKLTWAGSMRALDSGGRLVTCGATTGYDVGVDLRHLFYRRLSLLGSTMGSKGDLFRIVQLLGQRKLHGVIDRVLPLSEAAKAHELLADRAQFGKVVLVP
ncbi:zinc-binding dehydrogenase [Vulgatibacter incomptus]|uniref:Alcohol dehydrogenase n=1 Tax=Vulgatibacter incomptus TaxID=1391653 RepID=A0A0K1P992_9BACT|nr:zinc-binding dehydrogenase [Vulgatibacter incomptus]AKU90077.1 Alcohol dehydrogenase [Vulgatibacter incomptus]